MILLGGIQLTPVGAIFFYTFVLVVVLGVLFSITMGGAIVFIIACGLLLLVGYLALRRTQNRLVGGRRL